MVMLLLNAETCRWIRCHLPLRASEEADTTGVGINYMLPSTSMKWTRSLDHRRRRRTLEGNKVTIVTSGRRRKSRPHPLIATGPRAWFDSEPG